MGQPRALERVDGVLGRAHERLAVEVERRVQHGADAGAPLELAQDAVVRRVPRLVHEMGARGGVVWMQRGGDLVAALGIGRERQHHVGRRQPLGIDHVVVLALTQDRRGERHPEVAVLDHPIDGPDHPVIRGIGEDRPVAERARAELHPPGAARHHAIRHQELGDALLDPLVLGHAVPGREVARADQGLDARRVDRRPQVGGAEGLGRRSDAGARQPAEVGGADRVGLVAARREHEEIPQPRLLGDEPVGLHVHEDAAAQRQPLAAVTLAHEPRPRQQRVLHDPLGARRDRVEAQPQRRLEQQAVPGPAALPREARGRRRLEPEHGAQRLVRALGLAGRRVGRQAHHLVLVLAELHAEQEGDERIERAERARRARHGLVAHERRPPPRGHRRAEAVARVVVGEHECALARERRAVVGGRGVAEMVVVGDDAAPLEAEVIGDERQPLALGELELAARALGQAEPRAELARAPSEPARPLLEAYAVVLAGVVRVVQHAVHPVARVRARAGERDQVDVARGERELA